MNYKFRKFYRIKNLTLVKNEPLVGSFSTKMEPTNEQVDNNTLIEKIWIWTKKQPLQILQGIETFGLTPYFLIELKKLRKIEKEIHGCNFSDNLKKFNKICGDKAKPLTCNADLEKILSSEITNLANICVGIAIGIGVISLLHEVHVLHTISQDIERIQEAVVNESVEARKKIQIKITELKPIIDKLKKFIEIFMRPDLQSKKAELKNHLVKTICSVSLVILEIKHMIENVKLNCTTGIARISDKKKELNAHMFSNTISSVGSFIQLGLMASVANPLLLVGLGTVACAQLGMAYVSYDIKIASNAHILKITRAIENVELLSIEVEKMISVIDEANKFCPEEFTLEDLDTLLNIPQV